MKHVILIVRESVLWLLLLLGVDVFAALLLWIAEARAFYAMMTVIVLATVFLFFGVCCSLVRSAQKREEAFLDFLNDPNEVHEEALQKAVALSQRGYIRLLGESLRGRQNAFSGLQMRIDDYEEYVEAWAHEIKTPLSLLTFLLDNRREELPAIVGMKLDYIRSSMQKSVDQMLYYARLKSSRKDYLFVHFPVRDCVDMVLEDYRPLLEEKQFQVRCILSGDTVYSDRRGLRFVLGQIVSNSIKYCGEKPQLCFSSSREEGRYVLCVNDNGCGVRSCDLPFIFEKGFTGDFGEGRKKATGMGLYLAKEIAGELKITLDADSGRGGGFTMRLSFPEVDRCLDGEL